MEAKLAFIYQLQITHPKKKKKLLCRYQVILPNILFKPILPKNQKMEFLCSILDVTTLKYKNKAYV